jgi:hypothetical protein
LPDDLPAAIFVVLHIGSSRGWRVESVTSKIFDPFDLQRLVDSSLAREAHVTESTVKAAMRGERLRKATIEKLAKALEELL